MGKKFIDIVSNDNLWAEGNNAVLSTISKASLEGATSVKIEAYFEGVTASLQGSSIKVYENISPLAVDTTIANETNLDDDDSLLIPAVLDNVKLTKTITDPAGFGDLRLVFGKVGNVAGKKVRISVITN